MDNPIVFEDHPEQKSEEKPLEVHLDKWLWAARFYKTLALARKAIQHGKIFYNGQRSRSSVEISVGGLLKIQHGYLDKLIIITGLSTRRRSMKEAAALYQDISQHQETLRQTIAVSEQSSPPRHHQQNRLRYPASTGGYKQPHSSGFSSEHGSADPHQRPRKLVRFLRRPATPRPAVVSSPSIEIEVEVLD